MAKVLFAGASSFTGFYFAKALAERGDEVHALFQRKEEEYEGLRRERVRHLLPFITPHFGKSLQNAPQGEFDLLCLHAASTTDYKSMQFDPLIESKKTLEGIDKLIERGFGRVLFSGSVFQRRGAEEALSPYGVSKTISYEIVRFWCNHFSTPLQEFIIPHPFGIFEEPRLNHHLMKSWREGGVALLDQPETVFDFIPAPLLAKAYAEESVTSPSYFPESVFAFARRFGKEMEKRLPIQPKIECKTENAPPDVRIGKERLLPENFMFNEETFWDEYASWYRRYYL